MVQIFTNIRVDSWLFGLLFRVLDFESNKVHNTTRAKFPNRTMYFPAEVRAEHAGVVHCHFPLSPTAARDEVRRFETVFENQDAPATQEYRITLQNNELSQVAVLHTHSRPSHFHRQSLSRYDFDSKDRSANPSRSTFPRPVTGGVKFAILPRSFHAELCVLACGTTNRPGYSLCFRKSD